MLAITINFNLHFQFTLSDWRSIKKWKKEAVLAVMKSLTIKLFRFKKSLLDALDQDYFTCAC